MRSAPHFTKPIELGIGNPALAPGVTFNLGANNTDGTPVAVGPPLPMDCYGLDITITQCTGAATTIDSSSLCDIVYDPAGGSSYADFIQSLPCGFLLNSLANDGLIAARTWRFPVWMKEGTQIAALGRTVLGAQTGKIMITAHCGLARPADVWCGQRVDAIGDNRADSGGTAMTSGASVNTYGAEVDMGAPTARHYSALILSMQPNSGNIGGSQRYGRMSIAGEQVGIAAKFNISGSELISPPLEGAWPLARRNVPENTQITAATCSSGTSQSIDAIIHGVA